MAAALPCRRRLHDRRSRPGERHTRRQAHAAGRQSYELVRHPAAWRLVGSAFVSKDQLGHPLIHWLADQNDTVYVKRTHVKGAKDQAQALASALQGDKPVTVFPEGTTGPGTCLLPFRSTLLEAANYAAGDVEVRPVAIDYGTARADVGWFGNEPALNNVLRLIGRRGPLPVTINLLPPLDRSGDRKQLTRQARDAIARTLGFKSEAHSPIGESE